MPFTFIRLTELTIMPEIPSTVNVLKSTFFYTGLTHVTIPGHVKTLIDTFGKCPHLLEVMIQQGVTEINKAFYECPSLKSVTIPDSVLIIGGVSTPGILANSGAFEGCKSLQNVVFEGVPEVIGDCTFFGCTELSELRIPSGVTRIGYNAFYGVPHVTYTGFATGSPWGADSIN